MHMYTTIGKHIREEREVRGVTQKELAARVCLTRTSITNIESGKQKLLIHTLLDIARALGVEPAALLRGCDRSDTPGELDDLIKERPRIERDWIQATLQATTKKR
jgi:transcriptional regulator with XRE-family HTH domain